MNSRKKNNRSQVPTKGLQVKPKGNRHHGTGRPHSALHKYQRETIDMMHEKGSMALLLDPGLGKTAISLIHFHEQYESMIAQRALVIAPLRVMKTTWPDEMMNWNHLGDYSHYILHGPRQWRSLHLAHRANITLINPDGLARFERCQGDLPRYDIVYVDESTYFKSHTSNRSKALHRIITKHQGVIPQRFILTGTPQLNGVEDLFGQFRIVDPEILGKTKTAFYGNFGFQARRTHWGVEYNPGPLTQELIEKRIAPHAQVLQASDELDMPELIEAVRRINVSVKTQKLHKDMKTDLLAQVEAGEVMAVNAAVATAKCRQIANGFLYVDDEGDAISEPTRRTEWVNTSKVEDMASLHEELGHRPLLVGYQFKADLENILTYYKKHGLGKPSYISGDTTDDQASELIEKWNRGDLPMLLVNTAGVSHGLNLQSGGNHLYWYSLPWSSEIVNQFNARLYRQGQTEGSVVIHYALANQTIDSYLHRIVTKKMETERGMLQALRNWLNGRGGY